MGQSIRLTKPEREALLLVLCPPDLPKPLSKPQARAMESAIVKIKASGEPVPPKPKASISCEAAICCFKGVLGDRLVVPPSAGPAYWGPMQRGLSFNSFTPEQCVRIAEVAAVKWSGKIKAESLVRQGAVLLSEAGDMETDSGHQLDEEMDESWRLL